MSDTGAFTVVWQDSDGSGIGIVSQPYDEFGLPLTPGAMVVNTTINGKQDQPDVAMDDRGQCLVVWRDNANEAIRGQHFDANAAPLGNEILVSDPSAADNMLKATWVARHVTLIQNERDSAYEPIRMSRMAM